MTDEPVMPEDGDPWVQPSELSRHFGQTKTREALRTLILNRFANWLDQVLADELPLEGIGAELLSELGDDSGRDTDLAVDPPSGLYATWEAMTTLNQEVRLQGRAFKQLAEKIAPIAELGGSLDALCSAHQEAVTEIRRVGGESRLERSERESELTRNARDRAHRELVGALVEIRDRMIIGLHAASTSREKLEEKKPVNLLKRLFRNPAADKSGLMAMVDALGKGYRMGLERIDETLEQLSVREITCSGKPFDPRIMQAVDIEETEAVPEGTVLEVYRTGYRIDSEIFQTARVKVARRPLPSHTMNQRSAMNPVKTSSASIWEPPIQRSLLSSMVRCRSSAPATPRCCPPASGWTRPGDC